MPPTEVEAHGEHAHGADRDEDESGCTTNSGRFAPMCVATLDPVVQPSLGVSSGELIAPLPEWS